MMPISSIPLHDNYIQALTDKLIADGLSAQGTGRRFACVFEGKRPALFLKKHLAERQTQASIAPVTFSIEEFMRYTLSKKALFNSMPVLESCYYLYQAACSIAPELIRRRESFSQFLPWAREIYSFITILDLEDIDNDALLSVEASAAIGFDIPEAINSLLEHIGALRAAYHQFMIEKGSYSPGFMYRLAARASGEVAFDEFDHIYFCGFFYIQKTARVIMRHLLECDKASCLFQGSSDDWSILRDMASDLGGRIQPDDTTTRTLCDIQLYAASDRHAEASLAREKVCRSQLLASTVIVLPDPETALPLVSEVASWVDAFNISLGYPLKRSAVCQLIDLVMQAQKSRKGGDYYAKDYSRLMRHPLIKGFRLGADQAAGRILIHKIEEALTGQVTTEWSGALFIALTTIEHEPLLIEQVGALTGSKDSFSAEALTAHLKKIHTVFCRQWESITTFAAFAQALTSLLDLLLTEGLIERYPLNVKIADVLYKWCDELRYATFADEEFPQEDIFKIVRSVIDHAVAPFSGSPLAGLQILGLFETRMLNFDTVIIMDANEGCLPRPATHHLLIPPDVSANLGLDSIARQEEIQWYQFKRLIAGASEVQIIYQDTDRLERSRFIEQLIWEREQSEGAIGVMPVSRGYFTADVRSPQKRFFKTDAMINYLKERTYSASSVNTYLHCPLRFYYQYVLGLREKEEVGTEPDARELGSFVHELLEDMFRPFIGKKPVIDSSFRKRFFAELHKRFSATFHHKMRSDAALLEHILTFRLGHFLDHETQPDERPVEKVLYVEERFYDTFLTARHAFAFTYIIDRVDEYTDGSLVIIDYKTGAQTLKPQALKKLSQMDYSRRCLRDTVRSFQLPLYYYFEKKKYPETFIRTALYNMRDMHMSYFPDAADEAEKVMDICAQALEIILHEIIDPAVSFEADPYDATRCQQCPFGLLCR